MLRLKDSSPNHSKSGVLRHRGSDPSSENDLSKRKLEGLIPAFSLEDSEDKSFSETVSFSSKYFPLSGLIVALSTLGICVSLNRYYQRDIGGIYWPYISDMAKVPPESAIFSFGLTITSAILAISVTLNYGRVKREIQRRQFTSAIGMKGWRRNRLALFFGLFASPFLGLLAVFDTARSPETHLLFVLFFFPTMVSYVFLNNSVYQILEEHCLTSNCSKETLSLLSKSITLKKRISYALSFFVSLYLPIGLLLVTDFYNYQNDVTVHTFRAINQHLSVVCLLLYFGTFWYDFGDLMMTVIQYEE